MKQSKQNSPTPVPIMDAEAIRQGARRIAHEIIERNPRLEEVVLVGILRLAWRSRGGLLDSLGRSPRRD